MHPRCRNQVCSYNKHKLDLAIQLPIWMPESSLILSISGYFHPWHQECLYLLHPHPKIDSEFWSFIHPKYSCAKLYGFCHAFVFMPIWRSMFLIQFFKIGIFLPQDIEILGWCPAGPVLPHWEKVSL